MRVRAGWMVMGERGRPSALDVCRVLVAFLSLFPAGELPAVVIFPSAQSYFAPFVVYKTHFKKRKREEARSRNLAN